MARAPAERAIESIQEAIEMIAPVSGEPGAVEKKP